VPPVIALHFAPDGNVTQPPSAVLAEWLARERIVLQSVGSADDLMASALRGRPRLVSIDARGNAAAALTACKRLKADSFTGVVPCVVSCADTAGAFAAAFLAGADEVVREGVTDEEVTLRLAAMLVRSDRDSHVHPSTRLPGANEIEREILRRLRGPGAFAACYADLDHFKEYNDRYSWYDGDRVIRILARILHDVVKGVCGEQGFVGHIGGDDFLFITPSDAIPDVCPEIISCFDTLVPYQYSEQDRRAGYFFGKDRRGQLHKVPLMTVSIGVVTNERRHFTHASQVSELATEMKSYAKTLVGSVYTVDRRTDAVAPDAAGEGNAANTQGAREVL
jgi:GGDEF domain-containing protein